jgi:hypothetical protein
LFTDSSIREIVAQDAWGVKAKEGEEDSIVLKQYLCGQTPYEKKKGGQCSPPLF